MSFKLNLFDQAVLLDVLVFNTPVELGRREKTDPARKTPFSSTGFDGVTRWVIADLDVRALPRKVCRLEPLPNKNVRITNIHSTSREIVLEDGGVLMPGTSEELTLPTKIRLPKDFSIEISVGEEDQKSEDLSNRDAEPWQEAVNSILGPASPLGNRYANELIPGLGTLVDTSSSSRSSADQVHASTVLGWIQYAIAALQSPVHSPKYYWGIAQAVARIIDMDRAEVILWNKNGWEFSDSRRYLRTGDDDYFPKISESLLQKVLETKRVAIYPDPQESQKSIADSLVNLHAAVASPILDRIADDLSESQVLGVLYADRRHNFASSRPSTVLEAEQKLVAILSTAVASSIERMRREKLVNTYQQFFSSKVTEAISKNPALLEGESAEVSVLFCDIRGFSKATETIGPEAAMRWVSETLSELSAIVLDTDGVLVDYVGDEMFAMWGAPEKTDDHAFRAAYAAKQMMDSRDRLNKRFESVLPSRFDFGIGLCTGEVRVGNTGSRQKFKYGPMGKTVNMGSRIQGLTKQWGVTTLMDEATANCLPSDMARRRLSRATVIGMDSSIDLYELMSDDLADEELIQKYETALAIFETGQNFREAVNAFGELIQKYPNDGPSMLMLVRAVNELVSPSPNFSPVWSAKSKS